jgi:hypothetical protein
VFGKKQSWAKVLAGKRRTVARLIRECIMSRVRWKTRGKTEGEKINNKPWMSSKAVDHGPCQR